MILTVKSAIKTMAVLSGISVSWLSHYGNESEYLICDQVFPIQATQICSEEEDIAAKLIKDILRTISANENPEGEDERLRKLVRSQINSISNSANSVERHCVKSHTYLCGNFIHKGGKKCLKYIILFLKPKFVPE